LNNPIPAYIRKNEIISIQKGIRKSHPGRFPLNSNMLTNRSAKPKVMKNTEIIILKIKSSIIPKDLIIFFILYLFQKFKNYISFIDYIFIKINATIALP